MLPTSPYCFQGQKLSGSAAVRVAGTPSYMAKNSQISSVWRKGAKAYVAAGGAGGLP